MERFHLYTGLGGGFGGARYNQTIEAEDIDEAYQAAYELAVKEYQSYEGLHGIMNWGDCYEDAVESGFIDVFCFNALAIAGSSEPSTQTGIQIKSFHFNPPG